MLLFRSGQKTEEIFYKIFGAKKPVTISKTHEFFGTPLYCVQVSRLWKNADSRAANQIHFLAEVINSKKIHLLNHNRSEYLQSSEN